MLSTEPPVKVCRGTDRREPNRVWAGVVDGRDDGDQASAEKRSNVLGQLSRSGIFARRDSSSSAGRAWAAGTTNDRGR
jgi:hypothetical protein